jgi:ketosteroid isomerase-like protein
MIGSCKSKSKQEAAWKDEVIKTDEAFSAMSKAQGMKKAFIEYMDNDGILLRPNHLPIIGAYAIEYLTRQNDTAFTLTWKPSSAQVSGSGDLAFSFGVYDLQLKDTLLKGTYVSVWKKQKDGKWKFALDSGNEGIGESK